MLIQKWIRGLVIFLAGVIVGLVIFRWILLRQQSKTIGQPVPPPAVMANPQILSDFSLVDQRGKKTRLSDFSDHYWVADFFFTRCLGPCPILNATMAKLQDEFRNRNDLKFVSFTVDPEFDTPKVLKTYSENFKAEQGRWYFLTGPKDKVFKLIQEGFQLAVGPDETDPIQVVHSLSFVLIGKKGEVLGHFNSNEPEMLALLRQRIKELP